MVCPKNPQQGLSMYHCEAVLGFSRNFEVASNNFFSCQANPKKCMYSFPEESMCPGWVDRDFHRFPEVLENPAWCSFGYISLDRFKSLKEFCQLLP